MPDLVFEPIHSFRDAEVALIEHVQLWINTFLNARERKIGIDPGSISRPKSYISKQTFSALPGQEATPAIVIVSNGFAESPYRHGNGSWDVKMRMAVIALCHASEERHARDTAGHYQYALTNLLLKKRSFGPAQLDDWVDLRMEDVDEDQERTLAAVRHEMVYKILDFVDDSIKPPASPDDPEMPPDDSESPQPDLHTVLSHQETMEVLP